MFLTLISAAISLWLNQASAAPTWPAATDELEDIMFLNTGYRARGFARGVTPCSFSAQGSGRIAAAEWLRTAFHDMATGSVFTGIGGLDASIVFEQGGENIGDAFPSTLSTFAPFLSSRSSMADLIALGVYTAVRSCGGPVIAIRGGRKDAIKSGPTGVPLPQNSIGTFINQFLRVGFNTTEMIAVTACGHTLGGVHAANSPEILAPGSAPDDFAHFDSTTAFDEKAASEYLAGAQTNPLVAGRCVGSSRCSDARVFGADKNVTIALLSDPSTFRSTCAIMLNKMIEVVPKGTNLSAPIVAYEVKPVALQLSLNNGGNTISFNGELRVRTTSRPAAKISSVVVTYKDRNGNNCDGCSIITSIAGSASGFDDSFTFYGFSAQISANTSLSTFQVSIKLADDSTETYDNNGLGFPVQDTVMLQSSQSCIQASSSGGQNVTVSVAVRQTQSSPTVNLDVTLQVPRPSNIPVPALQTVRVPMTQQYTVGSYDIYSASFLVNSTQVASTKVDISTGTFIESFKDIVGLGSTCTSMESLRNYTYEGCKTDSVGARVLGVKTMSSSSLTYDECASFCSGYAYFGVEYGVECFCGSSLASSTSSAPEAECSMACAGESQRKCGGPDRLNVFKAEAHLAARVASISGYNYSGCYTDSVGSRTLSSTFLFDDAMTGEKCANFCAGAAVMGLEHASECYCSGVIANSSSKVPDEECNMVCRGDRMELCGNGDRLTLYQKM